MSAVGIALDGYRLEDGLLVPEHDHLIGRFLRQNVGHIDLAVRHCKNRNVVVQAGGNLGLWPKRMSELFGTVYTFEPDPINFLALSLNTAGLGNVIKFQAALGNQRGGINLGRAVKNCGAFYVEGKGSFPTLTIDDLGLTACDLIYLDVEGYERAALLGAWKTIADHSPVIAFEDKGLGEKYGSELGAVERFLTGSFKYRVVDKANDDIIMVRDV